MFGRILGMRITRWVATFLIVTFTLTMTLVNSPQTAQAKKEQLDISLATIGIENLTKYELLEEDYGVDMLLAEVGGIEGVELVPQDEVLEVMGDLEPNPDVAISVGRALGADTVLVGFISDLEFDGTEQAVVEVGLSMYRVDDGTLLSEAVVQGRSTRLGFSGSLAELAELAIRDGISNAAGFVFENLTTYGVVTLVKGNEILCNLSERDNVRNGAEIAIVKKGTNRQIASIEVDEVTIAHSRGKILGQQAGESIAVGDKVRLIYTPVVLERTEGTTKRVPKKKKLNPLLLGVVAVGVIAAASRGGNKAEPPNPRGGEDTKTNPDEDVPGQPAGSATLESPANLAAIYSPVPFDDDYIPARPTRIHPNSLSSSMNCYDQNAYIQELPDTAFNFTLQTSPKTLAFPDHVNYQIVFAIEDYKDQADGYTDSDINDLMCGTCTDAGEWELIKGTYFTASYLENKKSVSCPVSHFTPYLVVLDRRIDPIDAPELYLTCDNQKVKLSWTQITDTNNIAYRVYNCPDGTQSSCGSIPIETITDTNITSTTITGLSNGVEVCYSVSGKSNTAGQEATKSQVKCTTPSADPADCQAQNIILLSPDDGAIITTSTPDFVFVGTGDMDFYTLKVSHGGKEMDSTTIDGAGSDVEEPVRTQYSYTYSGDLPLVDGEEYIWQVVGYQNPTSTSLTSQLYSFTYDASDCEPFEAGPENLEPTNGAVVTTNPILRWKPVEGADEYHVNVLNDSSQLVYQETETDTELSLSSVELTDDVQYSWYVVAVKTCGEEKTGESYSFITQKDVPPSLPVPQWASGTGKVPLLGGDQIVSANWVRVESSDVIGYAIYRAEDPTQLGDSATPIDIVYKDQLGGPMPDPDCPTQFTVNNPGYCDISVDNGTKYYYKIASVKTGDVTGTKNGVQSIILELQRPELIGPGGVTSEDMTETTPLFQWFPINGPNVQYILSLIHHDDDQGDIVIWQPTTSSTSIQYDDSSAPPLQDGEDYSWKVKAHSTDSNGNSKISENSQTFRFTKIQVVDRPDAPNWCGGTYCTGSGGQSDPYETGTSDNSITLYWEKPDAENVDEFRIYRCQDEPGVCDTFVASTDNVACGSKTKAVCFKDTYLQRGSTYYYNVQAVDLGDPNESSSVDRVSDKSNTLSVILLLKGPSLVTPVYDQAIYEPQPEFKFLKEDGATQHILQIVKKPNTFSNPADLLWSYSLSTSGSGIETVIFNTDSAAQGPLVNPSDPDIAGTQYQWRVCSMNERYTIPQCSNPSQFYKNLKPPSTVSPDSGEQINTNDIIFQWTETPGAAGYTLRICKRVGSGTDCGSQPIIFQGDVSGTSYSYDASNLDSCDIANDPTCSVDGSYYWEIRAYDQYGAVSGSWENVNRELFYKVFGEAPQLIIPTDGQIVGPSVECALTNDFYGNPTYNYAITFRWSDIGAETYTIRIEDIEASDDASNPDDPNVVVIYEGEMSAGQFDVNSNCGFGDSTVIPFSAGRKFRWNVTAGETPFDADNAKTFITGLPAPDLISPLDGEQVLLVDNCDQQSSTLCLHFDWNGGTYTDENDIVREIPGIIGAESYDVEILKNGLAFLCTPQFTYDEGNPPNPPFTPTNYTFCDMSTPSVINGDVFTWRVRARDASGESTQSGTGIPGPWSSINQFTVLIPPVELASPPDSSAVCDPFNDPDTIQTNCTIVDCLNQAFYWSPIPFAVGKSCFKIDVSDTADFRNLIISADTQTDSTLFLKTAGPGGQELYNGYQADTTDFIPMTNGVVYYWRVGASVTDATGNCGFTWIYSDTWEFFKRPPIPQNVSVVPDIYSATLSWTQPVNCPPATSGQALSYPEVPPAGGEYIIYVESQMPDDQNPPTHIARIVGPSTNSADVTGLSPDTEYAICIRSVDNSFYINHQGHISNYVCVSANTLPEPEE